MTRTATLSAASLTSLVKAANAVELAAKQLQNIELGDHRQADLFEPGADQACEDFIAEREELKAELEAAYTRADRAEQALMAELDGRSVYTQGLQREIARLSDELVDVSNAYNWGQEDVRSANAVLMHIADFAKQLQAGLGQMGISYQADPETGEPRFSVNLRVLEEAVRDMIDRS